MQDQTQPLQTLEDIRQMMTKSSRFISLSGWSGVAAGTCALIATWIAHNKMKAFHIEPGSGDGASSGYAPGLEQQFILLAALTFAAAFILAFMFTYFRSRKTGVAIWGYTARKLMLNVAVPMIAGGLLIWRMLDFNLYELVAPTCLLFYGLALVNASKFTLPEIRYLGYLQLLLGALNLWLLQYGLYFWAAGFGVLHL